MHLKPTLKTHILLVLLFVAACSGSTDPHQGGFFGGLQGLSSGAYDQRQQVMQDQLARTTYEQQQLQQRADQIHAEQQQLDARLLAMRNQVAAMDANLSKMGRDLDNEVNKGKVDAAKRRKLQDEIASLDRAMALAKSSPPGNVDDMNNTLESLTKRYNALKQTLAKALSQ